MNYRHHLRSLAVATAFAAAMSTAHAAFPYTETFSIDNDAAGWFNLGLAANTTLDQNPTTDQLDFSATDYSLLYLIADQNTSGGAFVGPYGTFPIEPLSFDLTLGVGATVTDLYVELTNFTEDETWQYVLTPNAAGTTATFSIPLDALGTGWTQTTGDQSFDFLLENVEEFAIGLENTSGSGSVSGSIDNVVAVPEPSTALFGTLALVGLLRRRRTIAA